MNGGKIQPTQDHEQPPIRDENLQESVFGAQRRSGGGELPKMNIGEGIIYYVFFGWAWGYETFREKRHLIKKIDNSEISTLIKNLTPNQVEWVKGILEIPSGKIFLENTHAIEFKKILKAPQKAKELFLNFEKAKDLFEMPLPELPSYQILSQLLDEDNIDSYFNAVFKYKDKPSEELLIKFTFSDIQYTRSKLKTKDPLTSSFLDGLLFQIAPSSLRDAINNGFDKAQNLLNGRIDEKDEEAIKGALVRQNETFIAKFNQFLDLENKYEGTFPNSNVIELESAKTGLKTDNPLLNNLLDEIHFIITAADPKPIDDALRFTKMPFKTLYNAKFSLQYKVEKKEKQTILTLRDPVTEKTSIVVIQNPNEVTNTELDNFLNVKPLEITRAHLVSEFYKNAKHLLLEGIHSLSLKIDSLESAILKGKGTIEIKDFPSEIRVTTTEEKGSIKVMLEYNGKIQMLSYNLLKDETKSKLVKRLRKFGTFERDFKLALQHFKSEEMQPLSQIQTEKTTPKKMGFRLKKGVKRVKEPSKQKTFTIKGMMEEIKKGEIHLWENGEYGLTKIPPATPVMAFYQTAHVSKEIFEEIKKGIEKPPHSFPYVIAIPDGVGYAYSESMSIEKRGANQFAFQLKIKGKTLEHVVSYPAKIEFMVLEAHAAWVKKGV